MSNCSRLTDKSVTYFYRYNEQDWKFVDISKNK